MHFENAILIRSCTVCVDSLCKSLFFKKCITNKNSLTTGLVYNNKRKISFTYVYTLYFLKNPQVFQKPHGQILWMNWELVSHCPQSNNSKDNPEMSCDYYPKDCLNFCEPIFSVGFSFGLSWILSRLSYCLHWVFLRWMRYRVGLLPMDQKYNFLFNFFKYLSTLRRQIKEETPDKAKFNNINFRKIVQN